MKDVFREFVEAFKENQEFQMFCIFTIALVISFGFFMIYVSS